MPLRTDTLDEPQINLTPMIDIVFLLIIFFMVGTRFSEMEQQFDVELPTAGAVVPLTATPDAIIINVDRSGAIRVNNKVLTLDELRDMLVAAVKAYPKQSVLIRGDGQGAYQYMINIMDACHTAEAKFSLGFQPVGEG